MSKTLPDLACASCTDPIKESPALVCHACELILHERCAVTLGRRCPTVDCGRELVCVKRDLLHAIQVTPQDLALILVAPFVVGLLLHQVVPGAWKALTWLFPFPLGACLAGWIRVPPTLHRYALRSAPRGALVGLGFGFMILMRECEEGAGFVMAGWPFVLVLAAWTANAGVAWGLFRVAAQVELVGEAKALEQLGQAGAD